MAPHGGQARDTPLALRRVKRLGKRLGPERAVGHLALRYGARQALLRGCAAHASRLMMHANLGVLGRDVGREGRGMHLRHIGAG